GLKFDYYKSKIQFRGQIVFFYPFKTNLKYFICRKIFINPKKKTNAAEGAKKRNKRTQGDFFK
ncbi:hypothetical protein, partial [Bacillus subtilis]|uniref:hypothetical protein n=1 Tax=Bacillus subtilis TaxID=1423 RepID=UPI0024ADCD39